MSNKVNINLSYQEHMYIRRQCRDTVAGSSKVKYSNLLYLPMPSSFRDVKDDAPSVSNNVESKFTKSIPVTDIPWWHPNPAYRAYLQRARFPEITGAALVGMIGFATKTESKIELPKELEYLKDSVSPKGKSLIDFYLFVLSEVLTVGNFDIVVDYNAELDLFYLTGFVTETQIDWNVGYENGTEKVEFVKFLENPDDEEYINYLYDDSGIPSYSRVDGSDNIIEEMTPLVYKGKNYTTLPVFPAGSVSNNLDPQKIPLQGISDISVTLYQIDADLRQAEYMTCNPTLFVFGVGEKDTPTVIGSTIIIGITNPNARAEYVQTDSGALNHLLSRKADLFKEAVSYGANFIDSGNSKESAEALSMRRSSHGISLLTVVRNVGSAIEKALKFIAEMKGLDVEKVKFTPSTEFAETVYTPADLTALMTLWIQRAIPQDILLDNMRKGGYIVSDLTNEEIKQMILQEPPMVSGGDDNQDDKSSDEKDDEKKDEEDKPKDEGDEK